MSERKRAGIMYYIIYLIGIAVFLIKGIGFANLAGFIDSITLILVLFPCFLMLFCTKSFQPFGECFLFMFSKKNYPLLQCERCLQSIKMVISTAAISGMICFMIGIVNTLRSIYISPDSLDILGANISVCLLSLFYVLLVCILLLPLHFILKQHMMDY